MRVIPLELDEGTPNGLAHDLVAFAEVMDSEFDASVTVERPTEALDGDLRRVFADEAPFHQYLLATHRVLQKHYPGLNDVGVVVTCSASHHLARSCVAANGVALWGCNLGHLSLVYGPKTAGVIWHEVAHMMGADDCYPEERPHLCECELGKDCLMVYEPLPEPVGRFLCERNVERLGERLAQGGIGVVS